MPAPVAPPRDRPSSYGANSDSLRAKYLTDTAKARAENDTPPRVAYHGWFQQPTEAKMDDDTLTAIGELRKRVEELEGELDALRMEMKEELGKLMMKVNRLEKP